MADQGEVDRVSNDPRETCPRKTRQEAMKLPLCPINRRWKPRPTSTPCPSTSRGYGKWVAWTPEGYFTASARGIRLIGASMNQGLDKTATYISGEQLHEHFYRPELMQEKLHGEPHTPP